MSIKRSLITTDIDFSLPGFQAGTLRLPYSHNRSAYGHIPIPIAVLNEGAGPTVLLTGGNHGDEFEGPVALMKLAHRMPQMKISGRLIVIPALNFPAFLAGTRTSPIDQANLNRVFPGVRNGSVTEMIAHYVDTELFPLSDFIFDLHAGGASFNHLPTILAAPPEDPIQQGLYKTLVEAFGAPYTMIMDLLGEDRTYGAAVARQGKLFFCGEFGGFGSCNPDGLAIVEHGLTRFLQAAGLTQEANAPAAPCTQLIRVEGANHYLFAPRQGIFEQTVKLGEVVQAGQLAGRLFDPHAPWLEPLALYFKDGGQVVCLRSFAGVEPGDCIALLASETTWS